MSGLFVTFEGPDGAGKSTLVSNVTSILREKEVPVVQTREPGGTNISEKIRSIILDSDNTKMQPSTEILLFMAARSQHVYEKILPELYFDKIVICDRFYLSTLAYQHYDSGLFSIETIQKLNNFACTLNLNRVFKPDLTFIVDVDYETSIKRLSTRAHFDRMEQDQSEERFNRIRNGFLSSDDCANKTIIVDGKIPQFELAQEVSDLILSAYLERRSLG